MYNKYYNQGKDSCRYYVIIYGTMFSQKFLRWWERLGEMVGTLIFLRRGKIQSYSWTKCTGMPAKTWKLSLNYVVLDMFECYTLMGK